MMPLRRGRDGRARIDWIRWWPGDRALGRAPAVTLTNRYGQLMVRFGRDRRALFSERNDGRYGIPRRYWHGPLGLTLRIHRFAESGGIGEDSDE